MEREFFAQFDLVKVLNRGNNSKTLIDALSNRPNTKPPPEWNIPDLYARIQILAQTLASDRRVIWRNRRGRPRGTGAKEYARTGALQYNMPSGLFWLYHAGDPQNPLGIYQHFLRRRLRWMNEILQYECPSFPDPSLFPDGSWTIKTFFVLRKPYISKDDTTFYLIDNPVKKEWVFKVPYVAPSQWKGALRSAMVRKLVERLASGEIDESGFVEERLRLFRLFGNEKGGTEDFLNRSLARHLGRSPQEIAREFKIELRRRGYRRGEVEGFRGRLHFYPTFFDRIGLEVINPHDRKTGAGKHPIYFESVPAGTPGVFSLLYVPLDAIGREQDEILSESQEDLRLVIEGVKAMLTEYGFGAKTSSGYGTSDIYGIICSTP